MADDPFASLFAEAGPIAPSQLDHINSSPFLQDTTLPSPPPPPAAADVPTLNCALAEAQTELEPGQEPETEPNHGLGFDEQAPPPPPLEMVDVGDDDGVEVADAKKGSDRKRAPAPKPAPVPAPKAAALDPLVQAVSVMAAKLDPKLEDMDMDILEICARKGIDFAPPRWHRPGGYGKDDAEHGYSERSLPSSRRGYNKMRWEGSSSSKDSESSESSDVESIERNEVPQNTKELKQMVRNYLQT